MGNFHSQDFTDPGFTESKPKVALVYAEPSINRVARSVEAACNFGDTDMAFMLARRQVPGPESAALVVSATVALAEVTPLIIEDSPVGLLLAAPT